MSLNCFQCLAYVPIFQMEMCFPSLCMFPIFFCLFIPGFVSSPITSQFYIAFFYTPTPLASVPPNGWQSKCKCVEGSELCVEEVEWGMGSGYWLVGNGQCFGSWSQLFSIWIWIKIRRRGTQKHIKIHTQQTVLFNADPDLKHWTEGSG